MPIGEGIGNPPIIREDDPRAKFLLTQYLQQLRRMARSLTFLDADGGVTSGRRSLNIDAVWVQYVSNGIANTEDAVTHNLGRIPVGLFVGIPDKAGIVYQSTTAWTTTTIYLKASATTVTVNLMVF